ncbi:hypothetical protein Tco_0567690 [Tanacetum coccineum]
MLVIQEEEGEGSGHPYKPQPPPSNAQPTYEEPILNTSEPIPNVPDEAVYEEWDDKVERATTTAASLDAEQASGGSPRCQEAMGGSIAQTRSERVPTPPRDSPLPRVHTLGSDEGSMTLQELTVLCTTLSKKVESLEADLKQTKQVYGAAYTKLIMKGRMIEEINQPCKVNTLVTPTQGEDQLEDQLGVLKVNIRFPSPVVIKDKGKGKIEESEDEQIKRTKLQNVNTFVPMENEDRGRALELAAGSSQATITDFAKVGEVLRDKRLMKLQDQFKNNQMKRKKNCHKKIYNKLDEWDDLVMIWNLVKEIFSSTEPTDEQERNTVINTIRDGKLSF